MSKYSVDREIKKLIADVINGEKGYECIDEINMSTRQKAENLGHAFFILLQKLSDNEKEVNNLMIEKNNMKNDIETIRKIADFVLKGEKFNTDSYSFSYKKSKTLVCDESVLPKRFFSKTVTEKPNKALINEQLKKGNEVMGCSIETKNNIIIKQI